MISHQSLRWKLCTLAGVAVTLVSLIPQVSLWIQRGRDWQGSYACVDPDELGYSAYLNSLIDGRPRRNNPYLGSDGISDRAAGENLYSIQFLPAYAIALPARIMHLSASTVFILLVPIMAFASSLAVFWLLLDVTGNEKLAAVGSMIILLCGVIISESPFAENNYSGFPFLRRYIPALPFPLFFIFCAFVWRAFAIRAKNGFVWSLAAGVTFGLLVYSYFYLWTAAGAWLLCFAAMWLVARPADRAHILKCMSTFGIVALMLLIPYFYLLAHRAQMMDQTHALVLTHSPDLFRLTEIISAFLLVVLISRARRRRISWKSPEVLFAFSCALAPFTVFNQQIITGHALQSFHYEQFIINYLVVVGAAITYKLVCWQLPIRPAWWVALALVVGVATGLQISFLESDRNRLRDEAIPVFENIKVRGNRGPTGGVALFDSVLLAASAPTTASFAVLWSPHLYTFGSTSAAENRERFYQYLYYLGIDKRRLEILLNEEPLYRAAVFGLHRVNNKLTINFNPVTAEEIQAEVQSYSAYIDGFSREQATRWPLSSVILVNNHSYNLSNLDRWYERDGGERIAGSLIYGLQLRGETKH